MATKKAPPEPKIDWNIWHDAFMEAYDQIDFVTCAKTILYYKSIKWANEGFEYNPDDAERSEIRNRRVDKNEQREETGHESFLLRHGFCQGICLGTRSQ